MTNWSVVPPWLYQNDLPDDELQEVYVKAARLKVQQLRTELAEAEAFLAEAEQALAHYRGQEPEAPPRRRATVRPLPPPDDK
jgi:outer membrane protein TolC